MGKVCVVGCKDLEIDYRAAHGDGEAARCYKEGDFISVDGFTGEVMAGQVAAKPSEVVQVLIDKTLTPEQSKVYQQFAELMGWADEVRKLQHPHQRRQAEGGGGRRWRSGRRASACAAPSTCSSRARTRPRPPASPPCGR